MHLDPYAVNDWLLWSTATVIHCEMVEGAVPRAIILPVMGYGLYEIGKSFQFEKVAGIGKSILTGSIIAANSGCVAYFVSVAGERTHFAKIIGMFIGGVISMRNFVIYQVARDRIIRA